MSNIKQNKIMKKEYIKPFAKVKVLEAIAILAGSETMGLKSGNADPSNANAKEFNDFFE